MKRLFTIALGLLICSQACWAGGLGGKKFKKDHFNDSPTGFHLGVLGVAAPFALPSKPYDKYAKSVSSTLGYGYGASLNYYLTHHLGFHLQVVYGDYNQKYVNQSSESRNVIISYLEIPLLMSLNTDIARKVSFNVAAGPELGLLAGATFTGNSNNDFVRINQSASVQPMGIGLGYATGFNIALGDGAVTHLNLGLRGVYGNTNSTGVYVGLMFKL